MALYKCKKCGATQTDKAYTASVLDRFQTMSVFGGGVIRANECMKCGETELEEVVEMSSAAFWLWLALFAVSLVMVWWRPLGALNVWWKLLLSAAALFVSVKLAGVESTIERKVKQRHLDAKKGEAK
jgi:predicted nucleic-acid-binding Zn-ribbon protein